MDTRLTRIDKPIMVSLDLIMVKFDSLPKVRLTKVNYSNIGLVKA